MGFFFTPKSVAVVGTSPNLFKGGNFILKNLINSFKGQIYPQIKEIDINPMIVTASGPVAVDATIILD